MARGLAPIIVVIPKIKLHMDKRKLTESRIAANGGMLGASPRGMYDQQVKPNVSSGVLSGMASMLGASASANFVVLGVPPTCEWHSHNWMMVLPSGL